MECFAVNYSNGGKLKFFPVKGVTAEKSQG